MLNLNFQNGTTPALNARNMNAIVESINTLGYAVGGPNVASTVSAMTDTSKVYVYTGSETGYTAGNWYYYNGSAWVSGGVYQATAVETDTTLTMPGVAADAKATGDAVADLKSDLGNTEGALGITSEEVVKIAGYSELNKTPTVSSNSPFVYNIGNMPDFSGAIVFAIETDIIAAGTISIGTIKLSDAVEGQPYNSTKIVVKAVLTVDSLGFQKIELTAPFIVASDEALFIGTTNDTARWKFGEHGTDRGFTYVTGGNWVKTVIFSVGLNIYATQLIYNARSSVKSVYEGKTLSILGDSISTFDGYIPAGNLTYYPSGTVTAVTDTWWKKLADALGMVVDVNNSWSGSRVTTTAGDASSGCLTRCENLGVSPNVIIVWMGINDFNSEVALGTYDGTTAIPSVTTTFREAYGIMLNKILTKYQNSEVWICTLPQCERSGSKGFPEINDNGVALSEFNNAIRELADAFGVRVLEHNKCGLTYQNMPTFNPDNLHPNKFGHSLIANNDICQMDNAVAKRYTIE